ncbi:MAG: Gfo/Idh/MocA family oxidoreductase [Chloroflexi bacterium]|nr:Gfo/Idh/MocA family oxidoreductase [Chloroflexota bacterium]
MLRAGVIGVGVMGRHHARVYSELPGVELAAVADEDRGLAQEVARAYGARAYGGCQEMLEQEELHVASVAVPTRYHEPVALEAIARGVHLLVEKPLAATLEEGQRIVEAAHEKGLKLAVGHIERFNPAVLELKRCLEAGQLGKIYQIHARRLGPFPPRIKDVGVVIDLATHDLDVVRYLVGEPVERVYAEMGWTEHREYEDIVSALLKFSNGTIGLLETNWLTPTKIRDLAVTGERGMFVLNYLTQELVFYAKDFPDTRWTADTRSSGMRVIAGKKVTIPVVKREPLKVEIESFLAAVREDRTPLVSGEDGLEVLSLALRLIRAGTHQAIVLS